MAKNDTIHKFLLCWEKIPQLYTISFSLQDRVSCRDGLKDIWDPGNGFVISYEKLIFLVST